MNLTPKEQEVLDLMARGMKPAEVRSALGITRKAYACRRERIMNKLGAANNLQIGIFAARNNLIARPS